jgi:flavin-dependent dehydrogenase
MEGSSAAARVARAGAKVCGKEEKVVREQKAPGSCPYCGGVVTATDVEAKWVLCFLPLCLKNKRRFSCTACNRRLVTYPAILHD